MLLIAGVFFLVGCTRSLLPASGGYFIAPTLVGAANPIILETYTPAPPTARPPCDDNLVFLRDVTVPDGTHFLAGQTFDKSWELRNDGTCEWVHGYFAELRDGDPPLGAIPKQALPELGPGETVVFTIQFTAPREAGHYRAFWKAHSVGGEAFGVGFYVDIIVD